MNIWTSSASPLSANTTLYDKAARSIAVENPENEVVTTVYDAAGRVELIKPADVIWARKPATDGRFKTGQWWVDVVPHFVDSAQASTVSMSVG